MKRESLGPTSERRQGDKGRSEGKGRNEVIPPGGSAVISCVARARARARAGGVEVEMDAQTLSTHRRPNSPARREVNALGCAGAARNSSHHYTHRHNIL